MGGPCLTQSLPAKLMHNGAPNLLASLQSTHIEPLTGYLSVLVITEVARHLQPCWLAGSNIQNTRLLDRFTLSGA